MRIRFFPNFKTVVLIASLMFIVQAKSEEVVKMPSQSLTIIVGQHTFTATLEENETTTAFLKKLPLTIQMTDLNANEKCYNLPERLPVNAINPGKIHAGELMLFGASTLVLFYKQFATSYAYTKLGKIDSILELKTALGDGNPTVTFIMQF